MGSPTHPYPFRRLIAYVVVAGAALGLQLPAAPGSDPEAPATTTHARG